MNGPYALLCDVLDYQLTVPLFHRQGVSLPPSKTPSQGNRNDDSLRISDAKKDPLAHGAIILNV